MKDCGTCLEFETPACETCGKEADGIPAWIVMDDRTMEIRCDRCRETETPKMPMPVTSFVKWCEYFGDKHKFCTANARNQGLAMDKKS